MGRNSIHTHSHVKTIFCESESDNKDVSLYDFRKDHPKNFIFAHININHFRNKFIEIAPWLYDNIVDLLAISETKLDKSFPSCQFKVMNYSMYRCDRDGNGGGLICYVKSSIPHRERTDLCYRDNGMESMVLEISLRKEKWFFIIVYRPPSVNVRFLNEALEKMCETCQSQGKSLFIMGDINVDLLKCTTPVSDIIDVFGMKNLIKGPTCFKSISNPTLVDVIITDSWKRISKCENISNGISDFHNIVCAATRMYAPETKLRKITYRSYKNFSDKDFTNELNAAPFHVANIFDNVDDMLWYHNTLLTDIINAHAPLKQKAIKGNQIPYMNSELRKAINAKNMLRRKFNKSKCNVNWEIFRQQRNKVTSLKRRALHEYFSKRCDEKTNSKAFWETVKPFMTNKDPSTSSNITLLDNGKVITDNKSVCNIFNKFFINVANDLSEDGMVNMCDPVEKIIQCYDDHPSIKQIKENISHLDQFEFKTVNQSDVLKKMKHIKTKKAPGYDNIPPKLVKMGANVLSVSITSIYNECIRSHTFPSDLKHAEVAPLFKKGDNLQTGNYRPVSVLTCISKVFESLMSDQIVKEMFYKLSEYLAAYRKGYSCQHVLIKAIEDWKSALDKGENVGCVLMDLSKAFDSIPHGLLLAKLKAYGMNSSSCELMKSYLTGRKQRVKIGDTRSEWMLMKRGVPQGSITGPLLFNLFINDMFYSITNECTIYNYADDNSISYHNKNVDQVKVTLELALDEALKWFTLNKLQANPSKFQAIYFSRTEHCQLTLNIQDICIKSEPCAKLLGIIIDNKLTFAEHVSTVCKKAAGQLKALSRLSHLLNAKSKLDVCNAFVMSNFMYCNLVWHMCNVTDTKKIERIQERCLRYIDNDWSTKYCDLLQKYNKSSLYIVRVKALAQLVFDVLNGDVPSFLYDMFLQNQISYSMRDEMKVKQHCFNTVKYGFNSLKYQGAKLFNNLPLFLKENMSSSDFKKALKSWSGPQCQCGFCVLCYINRT